MELSLCLPFCSPPSSPRPVGLIDASPAQPSHRATAIAVLDRVHLVVGMILGAVGLHSVLRRRRFRLDECSHPASGPPAALDSHSSDRHRDDESSYPAELIGQPIPR